MFRNSCQAMGDFSGDYEFVRTRKEHTCDTCCRVIPARAIALNFSGRFDDRWYRGHRCFACTMYIHYALEQNWTDSEDLEYFLEDHDVTQNERWLEFEGMTLDEGLTHSSQAVRLWTQLAIGKTSCRSNG